MEKKKFDLLELLQQDADPQRVDELMKLVEIDLPVKDEVRRHLIKQNVEMFNIEYTRYLGGTKITDELVEGIIEDAIDLHVHGGSEPFERRQLEDEIAIDCTKAKMKAVVIKTWFTPSASRNQLVQKIVDKWAEEHQMRPVRVLGGITLNYSVGGLNPEAVIRCLGYPGFKTVWMPMYDSYYHQLIVFNRKDKGIKFLTDNGKVVPQMQEILRIIADNDLVLASGHYPHNDTAILMEEAKRLGVKRLEVVHPTVIHSKQTIPQMNEFAYEGVKLDLIGIASVNVRFAEGFRWVIKVVKELGEHMVLGTDSGQIQNPTHIEGLRWLTRVLLAYGITKEELTKIYKTNAAALLGIS